MESDDLRLEEIVEFGEGRLDLHGRRLFLHSLDAFAQFRTDLIDALGDEEARRLLTRFGYFWGHADAAAMTRIFEWDSLEEWLKAGVRMHTLQGVAKTVVKKLDLDEAGEQLRRMEVVWHNSGEAEEQLIELGRAHRPVCWMLVGYASGYASFCMGADVYFMEDKCKAMGDRVCHATGKDARLWGEEIKPYLPYFRASDIQGKIRKLTEELKEKTREIGEQRRKLDRLEKGKGTAFAEVRSKAFMEVLDVANRVAPYGSSVLITGESGVGKEVLARHIHAMSPRSGEDFVAVNCSALPETLLESELFGHKKGSFTGATDDREGIFERAEGGTIFLDEIGDFPVKLQLKLLRTLQSGEIRRVGESTSRKFDVRVMAATNRDLDNAIDSGEFREDLYYRLAVIEVEVPPLRERTEDILPLARGFVEEFKDELGIPDLKLHAETLGYLQAYSWPGNVRELRNAIERAAVMCEDTIIRPEDLPPKVEENEAFGRDKEKPYNRTLEDVEQDHIHRVLEHTGDNKTRASEILGISPSTLWRKLKQE